MLFNVKKYTLYFLFYNIDKKYEKKPKRVELLAFRFTKRTL